MKKKTTITTLWSLIESMQRTLETQGLDSRSIDVAVKRRLAALDVRGPREHAMPFGLIVPAKA